MTETPDILEILARIASVGLFLVALLAVLAARKQITATVSQHRASIMLELDSRWESDEMIASRTLMVKIWSEVRKEEAPENHDDVFKRRLDAMQNAEDPTPYREMLRLAGFFETAGWMVDKKYVTFEDFENLFGDSLRMFGSVCEKHLRGRQKKESKPRYYEHALSLIREAQGVRA
jgi:hypothetical protein